MTGLVGDLRFPSRASESRAAVFWAEPDFRYFSTTIPQLHQYFGGELVERDANSVAMSADAHGLALHRDGTVTFWGSGSVLSNGVPSSLRGVVAIAPSGERISRPAVRREPCGLDDSGGALGDHCERSEVDRLRIRACGCAQDGRYRDQLVQGRAVAENAEGPSRCGFGGRGGASGGCPAIRRNCGPVVHAFGRRVPFVPAPTSS